MSTPEEVNGTETTAPQGSTRNMLIAGLLVLSAAIIFGLLYLFVIAPAVPDGNIGWYLFSFATGLTMIVMPCTLPLAFVIVPLSMGKGMLKGISMAVAFGLGVTFTLSLYGIAAALLGGIAIDALGADLESIKNWVYFVAGMFALLFALSEIGLMNIHMPSYTGAAPAFIQKRQEILKAFFLGAFLGNVGVGCPHPATPLILIEIASSGDVLYGWTMFLIHAVGRVLPLLLLAFLAILGVNGLNWLLARKDAIERGTGWAMVFVAGFILTLGLFSHDWWVNSGLHSGLETLTQEHRFNVLINDTLGTAVEHVHGLEDGSGLFGLPLGLGSWVLVALWLIPIWWWYAKRKKEILANPNECDQKIIKVKRNFLIVISLFLALTFIHFLPSNFYLKSTSGTGHGADVHDHGAHEHGVSVNTEGAHAMADGTIMNGMGEVIVGAHMMSDGTIMFADGSTPPVLKKPFTKETSGLPLATGPLFVTLRDGDAYNITAGYVRKEVGNRQLRMLAYNGSIPGPFIKVTEGSKVTIHFTNETDVDQTIHSHGLRLDNRFDGVPDVTQKVVAPGESFSYELSFPDVGIAWYHPHTRDDYGQEMGLYGNYIVEPLEEGYWSQVNREVPLVVDDILIENGEIADFYKETVDHALLGRFGNTFMVNGETDHTINAQKGETIRFLVTNVSNARTYKLSIPGVEMKIVGADWGRYEQEIFANDFLISPSERMIVEVHFVNSGNFNLINSTPDGKDILSKFIVSDVEANTSYLDTFKTIRTNNSVKSEFDAYRQEYLNAAPDKKILLTVKLTGMIDHSTHQHGTSDTAMPGGINSGMTTASGEEGIQWNDTTNSDAVNTDGNVEWQMIDEDTGKISMAIDDWKFTVGDLVKVRFRNDAKAMHVMQHPIHLHGQKFVVLSNNGVPNTNMVWKDTALVLPGEYIDVLVEMSNPGEWMGHCHISEHLHVGMMMQFRVQNEDGSAPGDDFRKTVTPHALKGNTTIERTKETLLYTTQVPNSGYTAKVTDNNIRAERREDVTLTITDSSGNSVLISSSHPSPLRVTFVKSNDTDRFVTYPGNTSFDNFQINHGSAGHDNSDGHHDTSPQTKPASDGHDHIHMLPNGKTFSLINIANAHGGVDDGHPDGTMLYNYTLPAVFPTPGSYRAFVEFVPEGSDEVIITAFKVEVRSNEFSVDNYGWTPQQKWWILLIVSIILTIPLVAIVRKYINKNSV